VSPFATDGLAGATAIDTSDAVVTVSGVCPDFPPYAAVRVVVPTPTAVAVAPAVVATPADDDVQVATPERSWLVESL